MSVLPLSKQSTAERDLRILRLSIGNADLEAFPCGALWWPLRRLLVISDLHFEKASHFAARGQMLPPYDTRATLERIEAVVEALLPITIVSLGDSFHDRRARPRMAREDVDRIRSLTARHDWVWIEGNHDPRPPEDLGGRAVAELKFRDLALRHMPSENLAEGEAEIAGHLHPCARVAGRGRSVRARCFAFDRRRLVMPAYGALTGGLNVCDAAFAPLFPNGLLAAVVAGKSVHLAGGARLRPDQRPPSSAC